jgi:hypothetical protein
MTTDTTGIDTAVLLAALYNSSQPLGMGWLQHDPASMTTEQASVLVEQYTTPSWRDDGTVNCYFDYLQGRVMKIDVLQNPLDPGLYDRDNGPGAVARVVAGLRVNA